MSWKLEQLMLPLVIATLLLLTIPHAFGGDLPDPEKTPGLTNPALTKEVICAKGWSTKSVRNVPASLKKKVYATYGLKGNHTGYCTGKQGCEVDHLISLEIGGANDLKNLWPQSYSGQWNAHLKDALENRMHKLVCTEALSLEDAQQQIKTDWIKAYKEHIGEPK